MPKTQIFVGPREKFYGTRTEEVRDDIYDGGDNKRHIMCGEMAMTKMFRSTDGSTWVPHTPIQLVPIRFFTT